MSPPDSTDAAAGDAGLRRRLGALDGATLVVTNTLGSGIFLTPGIVAGMVPDPLHFLGVWLLGGALALVGSLAYAELAALRPRSGGEYVYLREAFGPLGGFLSGWTSFVAGFSGAVAAAAIGFAEYLGRFLPAAADARPPAAWGSVGVAPREVVALATIALFTAVHLGGIRSGRWTQNALALLNVLTIALLVVAGFAFGEPTSRSPSGFADAGGGGWLLALILVMFTYSGWNAASYVAGEIRQPGRNLPRALAWGTAAVVVLYLALNALYLHALGPALAGTVAVGDRAAEALFGSAGAVLFTPLVLLALASSIGAMTVTGPRVYLAMARDGCLPRVFGRVSGSGAPAFAILAQGAWSAVLVITGTFEALLAYTGFAIVLFSGAAVLALFVLRRRAPEEPRPYRAWGYPVAPAVFVLLSAAMVVQAVRREPAAALAGLGLIAAGVPLFLALRRRSAAE